MKRNTKRLVTGLAATGIVTGALAGGGVALASSGTATPTAATVAATQYGPGWCDYGLGLGLGPMAGLHSGQQPVLSAAATYLGLTQTQLRDQLQAGKSLADVAAAQHKAVDGLKNAILAAVTTRINASTQLTAAQKTALITQVKSHLDAIVTAVHPLGGGPYGAGMRAGMGLGYRGGR
jgi:hypothetical protein